MAVLRPGDDCRRQDRPKKHRETDAVEGAGKASFGQHGTDGIPSDEGHKPAGQRDQGSHPGAAGADT